MNFPTQHTCNGRSFTTVVPSAAGKPVLDEAAATTSSCGHTSHQQGLSEPTRPEGSSSLCWPRTSMYIQPTSPTVSELDCAITGATTAAELTRVCVNSSLPPNLILRTSALDVVVENTARNAVDRHSETDAWTDRDNPCNGRNLQSNLQEDSVDIIVAAHRHVIHGTGLTAATSRYPLIQTDAAVTLKRQEQHRYLAAMGPFHPCSVSRQPDAAKHSGDSTDENAQAESNLDGVDLGPVNAQRGHVNNSPSTRAHLLPPGSFDAGSIENSQVLTSTAAEDSIAGNGGSGGEGHDLDQGRKRPRMHAYAHDRKCRGTAVEQQLRLPRIAQPMMPGAGDLLCQYITHGNALWETVYLPGLEAQAASGHPTLTKSLELLGAQPVGPQLGQPMLLAERLSASSGLRGQATDVGQRRPEEKAGRDLDLERKDRPPCLRGAHESRRRRRHEEEDEKNRQNKSRQLTKQSLEFQQLDHQLQQPRRPTETQREPRSLSVLQYGQEEEQEQEGLLKGQNQEHRLLLPKDWTGRQEPAVEALQGRRAAAPPVAKVQGGRAPPRDPAAANSFAAAVPVGCAAPAGDLCEEASALRNSDPASDLDLVRLLIAASLPQSSDPSSRPAGREALHEALIFLTTSYYMERGLPIKK